MEILKRYKEQIHDKTYDEVIRNFMKLGEYSKKFRGILGKNIKRSELLKDLRDKRDRF